MEDVCFSLSLSLSLSLFLLLLEAAAHFGVSVEWFFLWVEGRALAGIRMRLLLVIAFFLAACVVLTNAQNRIRNRNNNNRNNNNNNNKDTFNANNFRGYSAGVRSQSLSSSVREMDFFKCSAMQLIVSPFKSFSLLYRAPLETLVDLW